MFKVTSMNRSATLTIAVFGAMAIIGGAWLASSLGGSPTEAGAAGDHEARLLSAASPEQRAIIADGVVSFGEMEAAIEATANCIENAGRSLGVEVSRRTAEGRAGVTMLEWTQHAETVSDEFDRDALDCFETNSSAANRIWQIQNQPSEAELSERQLALDQCFVSQGFPELQGKGPYEVQMQYAGDGAMTRQMVALAECLR